MSKGRPTPPSSRGWEVRLEGSKSWRPALHRGHRPRVGGHQQTLYRNFGRIAEVRPTVVPR